MKAVLWQQFSFVPIVPPVATHLIHRYQQKGINLEEVIF